METKRRVCVRGLIYQNGKLFAQKLQDAQEDFWCTPGGGVDPMESLHDALVREMIEETGVKPVIGRLVLIQQFATHGTTSHGDDEQLEFFFLIENAGDYETIDLAETTHGAIEIAEYGFIDPRSEHILPTILRTPELHDALEHEKPVLFHTELA